MRIQYRIRYSFFKSFIIVTFLLFQKFQNNANKINISASYILTFDIYNKADFYNIYTNFFTHVF